MMNEHFASLYGKRERGGRENYHRVLSLPPIQKLDRPDALFLCDYSIIGIGPISLSLSYLHLLLHSVFFSNRTSTDMLIHWSTRVTHSLAKFSSLNCHRRCINAMRSLEILWRTRTYSFYRSYCLDHARLSEALKIPWHVLLFHYVACVHALFILIIGLGEEGQER